MVCAYRARATRWERPIMTDPWAEALAGAEGHRIAAGFDVHWPAMELWLALRVAYLDRLVDLATDRLGVRQVVLLGAGYDTRAARMPRAGVRWYEVDHPDTQAAKRARLAELSGYPLEAATYVACDFERQDPVERLRAAGLAMHEPALVLWEGVVTYLSEAAIRATATTLARGLDPRSLVAFDFVTKNMVREQLTEQDRNTREFVDRLMEPVRFGTDHITPLLADCGYRWVRTLTFDEIALQFVGEYARDRLFRFQRIALCSPGVPAAPWP